MKIKILRKFFFLFVLPYFLSFPLQGAQVPSTGTSSEPSTGRFRWTLGIIKPDNTFIKIPESRLKKEHLENMLLFFFRPISNSYLYFFALSQEEEFSLIFPANFREFDKFNYNNYESYEFGKTALQPAMDTTCREFHMLVSTKRLVELERLITGYGKAVGSAQKALFSDILMYISSLRYRRFLSGAAAIPWEHNTTPSTDETRNKIPIAVTAVQFNAYFEAVFRYECK